MIPIIIAILMTPLKYYDIEGTLRYKKRCLISLKSDLSQSLEETDEGIDKEVQK